MPREIQGLLYPESAPPVAFGHYQLRGDVALGLNTLCLDVPDRPLAYRWDGEERFMPEKLVDPAPVFELA